MINACATILRVIGVARGGTGERSPPRNFPKKLEKGKNQRKLKKTSEKIKGKVRKIQIADRNQVFFIF